MSEIVFAIPGDLSLPTGGYAYDRRLLAEWRTNSVTARHLALPGSFPDPSAADLAQTRRLLLSQPGDSVLLVDGLAYGAFPESLAVDLAGRVVALVHHPLALETGIAPERAAALTTGETAALRHARAVVVTSPATARLLVTGFCVRPERICVAEPGVDSAARATGSRDGAPLQLLAVGSLVPRKGYDVLIAALETLKNRPWRLTIIGAHDRAPATSRAIAAQIATAGLGRHVTLAGVIDDAALAQAYGAADLFVMPSLFEGYGMVLTEALARGLPVICTTGGAAAETAPDAAALKIAPGDAEALAKALATLIDDDALRKSMSQSAWSAAAALPRWRDTAAIVAKICLKISA